MPSRRPPAVAAPLVASLATAALLVGCSAGTPSAPPPARQTAAATPGDGPEAVATIAEGLDAPWSIAFVDGVALVSERDSARILEVADDGAIREVGVVADVAARGEGGLLGIAVADGALLAYLTTDAGNRIDRYALEGSTGGLALGGATTILDGIPAAGNHDGGRIAIGPDGMLYATTGDAADPALAQDPASLAGKILRIAPDGSVPADNPFAGSPVWSLGHRNPQGIAWTADGTMLASEFGQDTWDELNVIEPGANYGWPVVEGIAGEEGFVDPVQQWSPAEASPSGIAVAGDAVVIANLRGARLRSVPLADLGAASDLLTGQGRMRDVVVAPDGALWALTNNTDGRGQPREGDDRILRVPLP
ncbi:PQQ-dependent sugar dehydrogenase [Agrococcus sp. SL85]|uniref:PQQ-dependent sugar dehydrogenase n=1 Tax=Agrococcus sp. SL85 TaxID=2995141 RepID=UPI00226CEC7C|nr:PQQ-dependent sugar dehydrogenase [Agrococcus sp. SL85]WAC66044.1 PQQ-dependent sugar dehydrogenase [Agrococcus sp. SL85]